MRTPRLWDESILQGATGLCSMERYIVLLDGFLYFTVADAGSADTDPFPCAVDYGVTPLQINVPAPLGYVMGMTDIVSEHGPSPAYLTYFSHLR